MKQADMKAIQNYIRILFITALVWLTPRAEAQTNVTFADSKLEAAVRSALGRTNGPLTVLDMQMLTNLTAESQSITNLNGLEFAAHLTHLSLYRNAVGDISLLGGLTNLSYLDLSYNPITHFTA